MSFKQRLTVTVSPDSPHFLEVPFELPAGLRGLRVSYSLSDPEATVDIGILDPSAGPYPSDTGFRGWSGSARDHFILGPARATPGYLAGPLQPGRWKILLGNYRVPRPLQVELELSRAEDREETVNTTPRPEAEPRSGPGWYRGDLHSHTHHSDGGSSVAELLSKALQNGLDFLAITDHNTISHHPEMKDFPGLTAIEGQEVTTYGGHFNVLGIGHWIDFRFQDSQPAIQAVRRARQAGGLCVLNHPKPTGWDWSYGNWEEFDAIEVWNLPWPTRNWVSVKRWHELLCRGVRMPAVGGSDRHQPRLPDPDPALLQVGSPTTRVFAQDNSSREILKAIKAGRTSITELPDGPFLDLGDANNTLLGSQLAAGQKLQARVQGGKGRRLRVLSDRETHHDLVVDSDDFSLSLEMPEVQFLRAELYTRPAEDPEYTALVQGYEADPGLPFGMNAAEILAQDRMLALTSAVYRGGSGSLSTELKE